MEIIVVGAGVTGITCAHSLLKLGHKVTLIDEAPGPCQGSSFGMNGFLGARSANMLCSPIKGKGGLSSVFAKTRRVSWDVSLGHMRFLRNLAACRSQDEWKKNKQALNQLARYSVGLTEFMSRMENLDFEQTLGLLQIFTSDSVWEEAHKNPDDWTGGEWETPAAIANQDPNIGQIPGMLGAYYMPNELSGNGSYFCKQIHSLNITDSDLTLMPHTTVKDLRRNDQGDVIGVVTEKGNIDAQAVVLCNNLGALPLLKNIVQFPVETLTGWSVTAKIEEGNKPPRHTVNFLNKDVLVVKLGDQLRVSGRFWIGEVTHDMSEKVPAELLSTASELLPNAATWKESSSWQGKVLITPDSLPIVGPSGVNGLYLNICHGLNGWTLAVGCADIIRAAIMNEVPPIDVAPYSIERFTKK